MAEVPCHEIVHLMDRCEGSVKSIADKLAMEDPARDVALGKDRCLVREVEIFERLDYLHVARAMRFIDALELSLDEKRNARTILRQLVLEPSDGEVAAERVASIEICADHRRLNIKA